MFSRKIKQENFERSLENDEQLMLQSKVILQKYCAASKTSLKVVEKTHEEHAMWVSGFQVAGGRQTSEKDG